MEGGGGETRVLISRPLKEASSCWEQRRPRAVAGFFFFSAPAHIFTSDAVWKEYISAEVND